MWAHSGQVTIIPLQTKQICITFHKHRTYVLLMANESVCAMSKRLERAISYMWL